MALNSNFRTLTADNIEGIVDDRNYLKSSFENGTITGWREMAVTIDASGFPNATPTIGTDASPNAASSLSLSATSTTPLSGSRSLLVTVPTSLSQGHGFISEEFTLDRMDLGKVLTVSFDYERISGTYNFSGTRGSQTWMVYIYDATLGAANWIQPAGYLGMNQSSGPGRVACTFQTSVTAGQKYRVAVIAHQAAAGASSIEFDNFTCSRQTAPIGPVMTDWVSYTPTGTWTTNTTYTGRWRRVGDTVEVDVGLSLSGAPNATTLYVNYLPPGISIDTSKMSLAQQYIRSGYADGTQGGSAYNLKAIYDSPTRVLLAYQNQLNAIEIVVNATAPITWASGSTIHMRLSVPISGWSSQVQLSNDTDTRVVAMRVSQASQQNLSNITETKITNLSSLIVDTHAAWNSANNEYVIPVSGVYEIIGGIAYTANATGTRVSYISIVKGGVTNAYAAASRIGTNTAADQTIAQMSYIDSFSAGDKVYLTGYQSSGGVLATGTSLVSTFLQVKRLSGPSVVAASETVAMRATNTSGQSISHNSATPITNWTRDYDTHSIINTSSGLVTIPVSGKYLFSNMTTYNSGSVTLPAEFSIDIQQSGSVTRSIKLGAIFAQSTASYNVSVVGSTIIQCNAGDTISIVAFQSSGATRTLASAASFNHYEIVRVGN